LYLAWKYADDFEAGLISNTHLGGDNCHRGMVMGAMIGAALGKEGIPGPWIQELKAHQALTALTKSTTGDAPMDHDGGSF
jgi:ADP-ribosylglycohydrolase